MTNLIESTQRLALLRAAVEALPASWPQDPTRCRMRLMLAHIMTLLARHAEGPTRRM
ncbi:hypothetical protein ACFQE0_09140 [Methylobacterium komagatae]|uniref:Uncharacterized protein n=1 Tax=Methylobacterium komagatae TaxID=374425 RepID=A0ABW2BJL0_9HYPH